MTEIAHRRSAGTTLHYGTYTPPSDQALGSACERSATLASVIGKRKAQIRRAFITTPPSGRGPGIHPPATRLFKFSADALKIELTLLWHAGGGDPAGSQRGRREPVEVPIDDRIEQD